MQKCAHNLKMFVWG